MDGVKTVIITMLIGLALTPPLKLKAKKRKFPSKDF
jgi:hypothetical protein